MRDINISTCCYNTIKLGKVFSYKGVRQLGITSLAKSSESKTGLCDSVLIFIEPVRGFIVVVIKLHCQNF